MFALFPFRLYAPIIAKIASVHVTVFDRRANLAMAASDATVSMHRRSVLVEMTETENLP